MSNSTACPYPMHPQWSQRSPINFAASESVYHPFDLSSVGFSYPGRISGVAKTDSAPVTVSVRSMVRITLFGMTMKLSQLRFHSMSEHLVSGVAWPLELHLIHDIEAGQTGMTSGSEKFVIGVFFGPATGASINRTLPRLGAAFSKVDSQTDQSDSTPAALEFNPNDCLPEMAHRARFYRYEGALTSGDLSETASWLVFRRPVLVREPDLQVILNRARHEPRSVEELNRRVVLRSFE